MKQECDCMIEIPFPFPFIWLKTIDNLSVVDIDLLAPLLDVGGVILQRETNYSKFGFFFPNFEPFGISINFSPGHW